MTALLLALALAQFARVEGTVANAATGEPVRKAEVTLYRTGNTYSATSDAAGKFAIEDVPPGTYRLRCSRAAFLPAHYGGRGAASFGVPLTLAAGQEVNDLAFRLTPEGVIAGRIVDEDGDAVPDVVVQALRRGYDRRGANWQPARLARANDIGEFRLANLEPGKYIVLSSARTQTRHGQDGDTALIPTYYPNASDASQSVLLDVAPGQSLAGIEIRLARSRVFSVSGRVLSPGGVPTRHARVELTPRGAQPGAAASSSITGSAGGRFTLGNIPPGSYLLSASTITASDLADSNPGQPLDVSGQNVAGVVVQLLPPHKLDGRIRLEGPAKPKLSTFTISLIGIESGTPAEAKAAEDGSFTMELKAGTYHLDVLGEADTWLKSVSLGGTEVTDRALDLTATGATALEVLLGTDPARIDGRVTDGSGNPVLGARAVLLPTYDTTLSKRDGSFAFKGLAPGDYKLYAWDDVETGAWFDPEFLKAFDDKAVAVTLKAGDGAAVTIEAQPAPR